MIQRIQTVYLIVVASLCMACFFCPVIGYYNGTAVIGEFNNWHFSVADSAKADLQSFAPCAMGGLLVVVFLLTIMTIFLYHYRMRQLRLVIFSTILLVGYLILLALLTTKFYFELRPEDEFSLDNVGIRPVAIFPVICIILNCLAIHGIRKDEKLVRSLDRLR